MIEESYVSFDTAKMLKDVGFDVPCISQYMQNGFRWNGGSLKKVNFNEYESVFSCPTQALAARWLREEHNIFIQLNPTFDGWLLDLFDLKKHQYILTNKDANADSYEQALEDGLREAIKLIK